MASFGLRDLSLLLPDKAGDLVSLRHTQLKENGENDGNLGHFQPTTKTKKPARYFAGQAPSWSEEYREGEQKPAANATSSVTTALHAVEDRRLSRLQTVASNAASTVPTKEKRPRRIYEAEVVALEEVSEPSRSEFKSTTNKITDPLSTSFVESSEYKSNDIVAGRSDESQKHQERENDGKKSDDDSNSDSDNDSRDSESMVTKPVFIPRNARETSKSATHIQEEELLQEQKAYNARKREMQTRQTVADSIRRHEEVSVNNPLVDSTGKPDDNDDINDPIEIDNWKLREIKRLKRDAEAKESSILEQMDLERRRNMTEEDRLKEDTELGKFNRENKKKWKFLQKYYHKGVFYMDDDSLVKDGGIRERSFDEPTLEDKYNKESLPSVMQVKNFGMRGRTKYTHLADQDTTNFSNPLFQKKAANGFGSIDSAGRLKRKNIN